MKKFPWPNGRLAAASFTFDLDAETVPYLVDPENYKKRMSLMSESTYAPDVSMPHILDLLDLYEVKATFFVPGRVVELHNDLIREVIARGHDIGHHGYMHERPADLSDELEERVLIKGIETFVEACGQPPRIYRSPSWDIKPTTPDLLMKHNIQVDSSLMGYDVPYWVQAKGGKILELPVSWRLDDFPQFGYLFIPSEGKGTSAPSKGLEVFAEEFNGLFARGGFMNMTMHPYLAGRPAGLIVLERLIRHVRQFPRVWIAPLSEIAAHCRQTEIAAQMIVATTEIPEARPLR